MFNINNFNIDFEDRTNLTDEEKATLKNIQENYRPIERVDSLIEFMNSGKITEDEFEHMTGVPYGGCNDVPQF